MPEYKPEFGNTSLKRIESYTSTVDFKPLKAVFWLKIKVAHFCSVSLVSEVGFCSFEQEL